MYLPCISQVQPPPSVLSGAVATVAGAIADASSAGAIADAPAGAGAGAGAGGSIEDEQYDVHASHPPMYLPCISGGVEDEQYVSSSSDAPEEDTFEGSFVATGSFVRRKAAPGPES